MSAFNRGFITGAQPKAGTGLKMQTVRFFQRYIVRDISLTEIYRWLIEISSAILKRRGMEDSQEKDNRELKHARF